IICFYFFDLYRGMWRYTSIADLINIIKASTISSLIIISFVLFISRFEGFSRSVFVVDYCFTILLISGFRIAVRFYFEYCSNDKFWVIVKQKLFRLFTHQHSGRKRLLILGAGDCGEKIYRELRDNAHLRYNVVGFLDDQPVKIGKKIHGIPVLDTTENIKAVANLIRADEALIAIPSASSEQMRDIVEHCKKSGISFKTIPSMGELIDGRVTINAIREVAYRDLLGREVVKLDEEKISAYINRQCVMITGAGGSIGSELCRQICRFHPERIILYERSESLLYDLDLELKKNFSSIKVVPLLADIRNQNQLEKTFETFKPRVVFHAAAYKHVPMLENQSWKAVENNIEGTKILIEAVQRYEVERFVFVSTDKAVRPVNVMGATKRVAELLSLGNNGSRRSNTRFMIVRFGNVVGSSGSVIPLFKNDKIFYDYP
ncbi:MAG: polysaccharide biosynthesis protein, partial [Deltaproteobacteria bacterium]|nr:polysaccharide biosynthesis protein [Deltaproteobacteria bacterium]